MCAIFLSQTKNTKLINTYMMEKKKKNTYETFGMGAKNVVNHWS